MRTLLVIAAVGAALFALDRLALCMETRGWLYYRHKRGRGAATGAVFLEIQRTLEPGVQHVVEARDLDDAEQDESGEPPGSEGAASVLRERRAHVRRSAFQRP